MKPYLEGLIATILASLTLWHMTAVDPNSSPFLTDTVGLSQFAEALFTIVVPDSCCFQVDLKMKAFMLRRVHSEPLSKVAHIVTEALEEMSTKGVISQAQRHAITAEIAARLHPVL